MAFQKGVPRPANAGRKKGTPNKKNTIFESLEQIQTEDGSPVDIVKMFISDMMQLPAMQRAELWIRFMEYIYPKQKITEVTGEMGIKIIVEDFLSKDE